MRHEPDHLWAGFLGAVVDLDLADGPARLRALDTSTGSAPRPVFPFGTVVHVITAWNPGGIETDPARNRRDDRRLAEHLRGLGLATRRSCGHDGNFGHAEPGWLVTGLDRDAALAVGRRFGQLAIYEWDADALTIVGTGPEQRVERNPWTLDELTGDDERLARRRWTDVDIDVATDVDP